MNVTVTPSCNSPRNRISKLTLIALRAGISFAAVDASALSCWRNSNGMIVTTTTPTAPYGAVASVPCPFASTPAPTPPTPSPYEQQQSSYQRNRAEGGMCSSNPVVYSCRRELGADTATTTRNRGYPVFNHSYLCVQTRDGYVCGGQTASSLYGQGRNDSVSVYRPNLCTPVSRNDSAARCVIDRLASPDRPYYGVAGPGTNCQEFTANVLAACTR